MNIRYRLKALTILSPTQHHSPPPASGSIHPESTLFAKDKNIPKNNVLTENFNLDEEKKALKNLSFNRTFALALNEEYLSPDQEHLSLSSGDILAVIPPISGG